MSAELGTDHEAAAPTGRRQRQRRETFGEIVATSRRLLRGPEGLSLRGVAAEMGMTPPALYRYVDSYADLQHLVSRDIVADMIEAVQAARRSAPAEDPAAQICLMAVAFRTWALENPEEFTLAFAQDGMALEPGARGAGSAVGDVFAEVYQHLQQVYGFVADLPDDPAAGPQPEGVTWPEGPGPGLAWMMLRHWVRLFGIVTLEAFRQVPPALIDSGSLFLAAMDDNSVEAGMADELPRLRALMRAQLTNRPPALSAVTPPPA